MKLKGKSFRHFEQPLILYYVKDFSFDQQEYVVDYYYFGSDIKIEVYLARDLLENGVKKKVLIPTSRLWGILYE